MNYIRYDHFTRLPISLMYFVPEIEAFGLALAFG